MILRKTVKTERSPINFYYEDIITYINKTQYSLDLQSNSKTIYKQLFKTNQCVPQNPWSQLPYFI